MKRRTVLIIALMILSLCFIDCAKGKASHSVTPTVKKDSSASNFADKGQGAHDYPELLLNFEAHRKEIAAIDLSYAETLEVFVAHCEYCEPTQVFHDPTVIAAAAKAIEKIKVTGDHDGIDSTATIYGFCFSNADGDVIANFGFQNDERLMLLGAEGRYPIEGAEELFSVERILLSESDWRDYYDGELPAPGLEEE